MTTPVTYLLNIYRGDSCDWQFVLWDDADKTIPLDLTGMTPKAEIRNKPGGTLIKLIPCSATLPNIIDLTLTATVSRTLPAGSFVWDLQLTNAGGGVSTVLAGPVVVTGDVTDSAA